MLRRSQLRCGWEELLSAEEIRGWVSAGSNRTLKEKLPTEAGIYRWLLAADGSEKPRAYVGETENLRSRISRYLRKARAKPKAFIGEKAFEEIKEGVRANHRYSTIRVGNHLAQKCSTTGVQLQRLRITEEAILCGVEISERLLSDEVGRELLENWAILSTERKGYAMLNRSRNAQGKKLWRKLHPKAKREKEVAFEGARL